MSSSETPLAIAQKFVDAFETLQHRRLGALVENRDLIIRRLCHEGWLEFRDNYIRLRQDAENVVQEFRNRGDDPSADMIIRALREDSHFFDPSEFCIQHLTGYGREVFTIRGSPELILGISPPRYASGFHIAAPIPRTLPGHTTSQSSRTSSLAPSTTLMNRQEADDATQIPEDGSTYSSLEKDHEPILQPDQVSVVPHNDVDVVSFVSPVDVELVAEDVPLAITFDEAQQQRLWVSRTSSGFCFCVVCPCPEMAAKSLSIHNMGYPTWVPIPRHFHVDPFVFGHAIRHFKDVHFEVFHNGLKEMLQAHGRRVSDGGHDLDVCRIIEHNMSVKLFADALGVEWSRLREMYPANGAVETRPVGEVRRDMNIKSKPVTMQSMLLPAASPSEEQVELVLFCNAPDCVSPLLDGPRVHIGTVQHLQRHGVFLSPAEVPALFGYELFGQEEASGEQDVDDPSGDIANNDERGLSPDRNKASFRRKGVKDRVKRGRRAVSVEPLGVGPDSVRLRRRHDKMRYCDGHLKHWRKKSRYAEMEVAEILAEAQARNILVNDPEEIEALVHGLLRDDLDHKKLAPVKRDTHNQKLPAMLVHENADRGVWRKMMSQIFNHDDCLYTRWTNKQIQAELAGRGLPTGTSGMARKKLISYLVRQDIARWRE